MSSKGGGNQQSVAVTQIAGWEKLISAASPVMGVEHIFYSSATMNIIHMLIPHLPVQVEHRKYGKKAIPGLVIGGRPGIPR